MNFSSGKNFVGPNESLFISGGSQSALIRRAGSYRGFLVGKVTTTLVAVLFAVAGCSSPPLVAPPIKIDPEIQILRPGDVIKIAFPGSPSLETQQQIRRD